MTITASSVLSATTTSTAATVRAESVAFATNHTLPWIPILGNSIPIRRLLWTWGGTYDRTRRQWSVPQHRSAEAQAIADRFTTPKRAKKTALHERPIEPRQSTHRVVDAPPERVRGLGSLSDAEVLALVASSETPTSVVIADLEQVLARGDGLMGILTAKTYDLRERLGGIGNPERIEAAVDLVRRLSHARRRERPTLQTPEQVSALMGPLIARLAQEEFYCLPLDPQSRLIGEPIMVSRGDVDGTDAGPRSFFRNAVAAGATSCIAVHNHPTGDPAPSAADRAVTVRLVAAGRTVDLPLVDHVVIGDGGRFTSLRRDRPDSFR